MVQNTNNEKFDNHQFIVTRDAMLDEEYLEAQAAQERQEALRAIGHNIVALAARKTAHSALMVGRGILGGIDQFIASGS